MCRHSHLLYVTAHWTWKKKHIHTPDQGAKLPNSLESLAWLAPLGHRMSAMVLFALSSSVRMVNWVRRNTTHSRAPAVPSVHAQPHGTESLVHKHLPSVQNTFLAKTFKMPCRISTMQVLLFLGSQAGFFLSNLLSMQFLRHERRNIHFTAQR
jgi:hypothetical protein